MKNVSIMTILGIILCALVVWLGGCGYVVKVGEAVDRVALDVLMLGSEGDVCAQLGETDAEARRRHLRSLRINHKEMMEDIDLYLLTDKPSKLTDKRIP